MSTYTCKYCGQPSNLDPVDQTPPADYCHPEDHGMLTDDDAEEYRRLYAEEKRAKMKELADEANAELDKESEE